MTLGNMRSLGAGRWLTMELRSQTSFPSQITAELPEYLLLGLTGEREG